MARLIFGLICIIISLLHYFIVTDYFYTGLGYETDKDYLPPIAFFCLIMIVPIFMLYLLIKSGEENNGKIN